MAAVNGNELHYFWGRSDLSVEDGHTQLEAARSNFPSHSSSMPVSSSPRSSREFVASRKRPGRDFPPRSAVQRLTGGAFR
jgi:hypothetical protein